MMNELNLIRKENLENLIKVNFRSKSEFARHIGKSPAQVGNWFLQGKGRRAISESSAREIESKLGLESLFLDNDYSNINKNIYQIDSSHETQEKRIFTKYFKDFIKFFPNIKTEAKNPTIPNKFLEEEINKIEQFGCRVLKLPKNNKFNFLGVNTINGLLIFPDFLVEVEETGDTFFIDLLPEQKFKFFAVNPTKKNKEVLFVKNLEVMHLSDIAIKHITKWF